MKVDDRLKEWAAWNKAKVYYGHCGSLEGLYRSPQCWHPPEARPEEINEPRALETERAMRFLPAKERKLIKFIFIYRAEPRWICLRLVIPVRDYDLYLNKARQMVSNLLGLTQHKNAVSISTNPITTSNVRLAA